MPAQRIRGSNAQSHGPQIEVDLIQDFEVLDGLPQFLRDLLNYGPDSFSARDVVDQIAKVKARNPRETTQRIVGATFAYAIGQTINARAAAYRAQCGCEYPHIAARATIQPPDPWRVRRRRNRP